MRELNEVLQGMSAVEFSTRAMFDFKFFVERVFGDEVPEYVNEVVRDILDVLSDDTKDGIAIQIPRGHSKTWSFTMNFAVWMLWRNDNFRMCLASSALTQAEDFMDEIQGRLKDNDFFKGSIPNMTKHAWNKSKTTFNNGSRYIVRPFSDTIRGTHVNAFFLDDILREGQMTIEELAKVFWGILYPTVQTKGGKIIFVGTPMSIGDLFSELETKSSFVVKKYQAVSTDESGNWIRPLWPSKFSLEKLRKIKDTMSPMFFEREYMCNPLAGSAGIFGAELIKRQSDSYEIPERRLNCNYYLGIDIALSSQARADFTVFVVIEKDEKGKLWMRRLERYKGVDTHFIIDRAKELDRIFQFVKLMPENRGLSQGIVMDMQNTKLHPQIALRTEGFITTKNNKEALISNLSQQLSSGNLHLIPNDILLKEMMAFSKVIDKSGKETFEGIGEHDDTVMALGIAVNAAFSVLGEYFIDFV